MSFYSQHILPHLLNCACGAKPIARQRQKVVPRAEGVVLEIGFGSGLNVSYYQPGRITKLLALEPEPGIAKLGARAAANAPFPVEIIPRTCETAGLDAASVDTIVITYTMCTIPDPVSALRMARPALKPGGALLFCEHGRAPDVKVQRTQARIEPVWKRMAGGCRLSRDIPGILRESGFMITQLDEMYLPGTPRFAGYNYWGEARPA
jgi:SAM-dependent methyltransferase